MMKSTFLTVLLLLIAGIRSLGADDTALYVNTASSAQPNIVIVYDTSGSMCIYTVVGGIMANCNPSHPDYSLRRDIIVRNAFIRFLNKINNVNVSALSFNTLLKGGVGPWGGRVRFASEDINNARSNIISTFTNDIVADDPNKMAPVDTTIYEALLYISGQAPFYGTARDPSYPTEVSVTASISGNNYISPITDQCQETFIILFNDGESYGPGFLHEARITSLLSQSTVPVPAGLNLSSCISTNAKCLDELAWYAHNNDLSAALPGIQTARFFTIGGFITSGMFDQQLQDVARHGGGQHFSISDEAGLDNAFADIISIIGRQLTLTQTAPATSLSAFNSLQHSEEIYYIVFQPDAGPGWSGNLKRYRLGSDNRIYDADGNLAIDPATGFFATSARSFWSSSADGLTITSGGMAEQLDSNRPVFTNTNGDSSVSLGSLANELHENNPNITEAMLGAGDAAEAEAILKWARGVDVDDDDNDGSSTDNRTSIGDPLHTKPQVITYYRDNTNTPVVDRTVYFTTNDGFLHGVDSSDGSTEFSFIPEDLLENLKIYRDGAAPGGRTKVYGMDGPMTSWVYDKNGDGDLLQSDNGRADTDEHAYLYLTMRRGGNNIYAIDVTDRSDPELKWVIRGDVDNDHHTDASGEFRHLGQTWSKVKPATVKWNGNEQAVLFFSGGYDVDIDGQPGIPNRASNIGNAVYMVDAERGSLLWTAGQGNGIDLHVTGMVFSIPAELSLVDYDGDGSTDFFFAVDTGGQIFRFDIDDGNTGASDFATGGRIARLAGVDNPLTARRFFEAPVVAFSRDYDAINIAVGSGYRPSPLSTATQDRLYVIRDVHVNRAPTSYNYASGSYIREGDLYDATDNLIQNGTTSEQTAGQAALDSAHGWYINLEGSGEKVLSSPVIHSGVLSFTTLTPGGSQLNTCSVVGNSNHLYAVNIENGASVINFDSNTATLDKADRLIQLSQTGIAPEPSLLVRNDQGAEFCVGTECFQGTLQGVQGPPLIFRTGWRENR